MIDLKGTMGIPFLKKSRFTGSDGALRFMLEKRSGESVPADALWPGREAPAGNSVAGPAAATEGNGVAGPAAATEGNGVAGTGGATGNSAAGPGGATGNSVAGTGAAPAGDCLAAVCWHGPYCSDATPDEEKTTAYFPFTKDGLEQAQKWLNAQR